MRINDSEISATLITKETRKAHKEHTCAYCDHPIKPGEVYWRLVWIIEDEFVVYKAHSPSGMCGVYS